MSPDGSQVFVTGRAGTVAYDAGSRLWKVQHGQAGTSFAPVGLGVSSDGSSVVVTGTSTPASGHSQFATVAYGS